MATDAAASYERAVASALAMDARQMWQHYCSMETIFHAATTTTSCPTLSVPKEPAEMGSNDTSTADVLSGNTGQHSETDDTNNVAEVPAGVRGATDQQYLAESLVRELRWGQVSVQVREQETRYVEVLSAKEEERRDGDVVPRTDPMALAKDDDGKDGDVVEPIHGTSDCHYLSSGIPEHSLGAAEADTDTNRPESETDTVETDTHRPESETDTYRPESETDTNRPESESDTNRPESETDTNRPESETDTYRPESETDTNRPESDTNTYRPESETHAAETDTHRPESETDTTETDTNIPRSETHIAETDTNRPESETDTYRPESETDTYRPESETDTYRPEWETDTYRPESESDTNRPESETDTNRPESETDIDGTDATIDYVTSVLHSESETTLASKSASICSTTMQETSAQTKAGVRSTVEVATNTVRVNLQAVATNTAAPSVAEAQCNTDLSCSELLENIYGTKKWHKLQEDYRNAMSQLNEERSQKMVAEQLLNIVQSDFNDLRQKTIGETTSRLRLENEIGDIKGELSHTQRQVEERDRRITELEESLTGTSLLVRRLEEQNSVSLMSRGGIDYMLEAKLAEGRAQEAEQKVLILQTELLQSQNEVRRLLDRVAEATREKTEMVSSKVHTQLLEIADEKAMAAERRASELDKEVHDLKRKLVELNGTEKSAKKEHEFAPFSLTTSTYGYPYSSSSYPLSSSYPTLSSSFSPFTYTSEQKLPTLEVFKPSLFGSYTNGNMHTSSQPSSSILEKPSSSLYSQKAHGDMHTSSQPSSSILEKPSSSLYSQKAHGVSLDDHMSKTSVAKEEGTPCSVAKEEGTPSRLSSVGSKGLSAVDLPSFDTAPELDRLLQPASTTLDTVDSDSSNWSSSDDETGAPANLLRPSALARLTAQWEWRAMQDGTAENQTPVQTVVTSPTKNKPPLAPKPKPFQQSSSNVAHKPPPTAPKPSHWTGSHEVTHESPSSFDDPKKEATLFSLTCTRPRGPNGRNIPSRYHWSHGTPS